MINMTKARLALLLVFLFLAGVGLDKDIGGLKNLGYTVSSGQDTLINIGVLCLIWLPLAYLAYRFSKKLKVSPYVLPLAIFGGITISGHLGGAGNSLIDIINANFIKDPVLFNQWTDALTAPFSEEFFKATVAFMVMGVLGLKDLRSLFISGFGVGLGFQIIEDTWYVALDASSGTESGLPIAIDRISGGIGSHAVYTAIVVVGLYILLTNDYRKHRLLGWWFVLGTVANHFLWNSPLTETDHNVNILVSLLFVFIIYAFIQTYLFVAESKKEPDHHS